MTYILKYVEIYRSSAYFLNTLDQVRKLYLLRIIEN